MFCVREIYFEYIPFMSNASGKSTVLETKFFKELS